MSSSHLDGEGEESSDTEYEVEAIVGHRMRYGRIEYLIKWKGWDDSYNEWHVEKDLSCSDLLVQYRKQLDQLNGLKKQVPEKIPRKRGRPRLVRENSQLPEEEKEPTDTNDVSNACSADQGEHPNGAIACGHLQEKATGSGGEGKFPWDSVMILDMRLVNDEWEYLVKGPDGENRAEPSSVMKATCPGILIEFLQTRI
jgi:hypothetical protein